MTQAQDEYQERRRLEALRKKSKRATITPQAIAQKITGKPCRCCGRTGEMELHHLVPRAKFIGVRDSVVHHADNIIPLCHGCHQDHHTTTKRVPRAVLSQTEMWFVLAHTSEAWAALWYPAEAA